MCVPHLRAVDRVADLQLELAVLVGQCRVPGGHVRVVEHHVALDRAADRHRPVPDRHQLARVAVAVEDLDYREPHRPLVVAVRVHPKPSR